MSNSINGIIGLTPADQQASTILDEINNTVADLQNAQNPKDQQADLDKLNQELSQLSAIQGVQTDSGSKPPEEMERDISMTLKEVQSDIDMGFSLTEDCNLLQGFTCQFQNNLV